MDADNPLEDPPELLAGNAAVMRKALLDSLSLPAFILFFTMMGFGRWRTAPVSVLKWPRSHPC
jgi:hypothetical protein